MRRYVLRRLTASVATVFLISVVVFLALQAIPGDAAIISMGEYYAVEDVATLREKMGLDLPLYIQYGRWLVGLPRGDMGTSLRTGQPISGEVVSRLPVTLEITVLSLLVSLLIAVPAGIVAATHRRSFTDFTARGLALFGISVPNFWLGLMLILLFSLHLRWLPSGGYQPPAVGMWMHLGTIVLPVLTLGTSIAGTTMRITRASMLEVLNHDYIRTGRAKGLSERRVVAYHALRNALIPLVTVVGLQFGDLLGRTVIIEEIFSLPGLGRMIVGGVFNRDYPVVMAAVLLVSTGYTLANLTVDLLYGRIDPRIRYD